MMAMSQELKFNLRKHLLEPVSFKLSPHHDDRPENCLIDLLVLHNISLPPGQFGSDAIEKFFCGQLDFNAHPYFADIANLRVSSHLLIRRDGEIIQFVPFNKRAWHAGVSLFNGKTKCNDFSIGIELEGSDYVPFTSRQYQRLVDVIELLMQTYPAITQQRIVGHEHIAPGRKTDPGPFFDWDLLATCLKERSTCHSS